jgi:integrase
VTSAIAEVPSDDSEKAELRRMVAAQADKIRALTAAVRALGTVRPSLGLTVLQLWDKYSAAQRSEVKPRSWMAVRSRMKPILGHFGASVAENLAPADEVAYRSQRLGALTCRKTRLSRATYNHEVIALLTVLNWAVANDYLEINPLRKVKLKKASHKRKTLYSEEDLDALLASANPWLKAMILVIQAVGMRTGEILGLEREQLDRATRFVHLRGDQTKNGKARSVRLSVRAMEAIDSLPHGISRMFGASASTHQCASRPDPLSGGGGKWVFTNPKTGNHWSHRCLNTWWRDLVARTGLKGAPGETPRFYDFRHTHATRAHKAGVSLPVIRETLGHSDYRILEVYLHVDEEDIAGGADRLEAYGRSQRASAAVSR